MKNVLNNYTASSCCGCGNCVNVCPVNALSLREDSFGFLVPELQSDCISCGKCINVCPYYSHVDSHQPIKAYAAASKDSGILMTSASGGVFFHLASQVLEHGGIVFGSCMDEKFKVHHIEATKISELHYLQKSKYVQSHLADIVKKIEEYILNGKQVLFSGTPCQVAAIIRYLRAVGIDEKKLITVDVVCHGVPSQKMFNEYLKCVGKKHPVEQYTFKAKRKARNGMNSFICYKRAGEKEKIRNWSEDSFNYYYMNRLIYRDSCYDCRFAKEQRLSDITLCDYWGWIKYHSDSFHKDTSLSGVIINTKKGSELIDLVREKLDCVETRLEWIKENNGSFSHGYPAPEERACVMDNWCNGGGYLLLDKEFRNANRLLRIKGFLVRIAPEFFSSIRNR